MSIHKLFYSYQAMHHDIDAMIATMAKDAYKPDVVVGITRGGLVPAVVFSHMLDVPMKTIEVSFRDSGVKESCVAIIDLIRDGKKVLLVDDICDSGETLEWIYDQVKAFNLTWTQFIRTAVLINNQGCTKFTPDYKGSVHVNKSVSDVWIVFPYEKQD